ncbi:MAG: helix-turn-helix transcriptional regulator [Bacteroidales bacterium]|jgi:YesN/AraC family two-component response regulator|nr:helix-turn-helix transcriptional regulator [Bacteroidales bacterium]
MFFNLKKGIFVYFCSVGCPIFATSNVNSAEKQANESTFFAQFSTVEKNQTDSNSYSSEDIKVIDYQLIIDSLQNLCSQLQFQIGQKEQSLVEQKKREHTINRGIIIILVLDILGLFAFFYLEQKRTYVKLARKNMEWATRSESRAKLIENTYAESTQLLDNQSVETKKNTYTHQERHLLLELIKLLNTNKLYLKPEISIQSLAKQLKVNRITVSRLIHLHFHKSFPALLNEYRVNEAILLLTDPNSNTYTLEAIGEMCGFRNRQVFHTTFKKITGLTPNGFRTMSSNKDFNDV